jgi:hypothetical protein
MKAVTAPIRASHIIIIRGKKETEIIEEEITSGLKEGKLFRVTG